MTLRIRSFGTPDIPPSGDDSSAPCVGAITQSCSRPGKPIQIKVVAKATIVKSPRHRRPEGDSRRPLSEVRAEWQSLYEPVVVEQLDPRQRYSIVRVGTVQFAYTTYEGYITALSQVWEAGFVPASGHTGVLGTELPEAAPRLKGVDTDLTGLTGFDVEVRRRRFR